MLSYSSYRITHLLIEKINEINARNRLQTDSISQMPRVFEVFHTVRSYELDFLAHVNNAVYLNYLEYGRFSAIVESGIDWMKLMSQGLNIVIARIEVDFVRPAVMGDKLRICSHVCERGTSSFIFRQVIDKPDGVTVIARADCKMVTIDANGKPIPIPDEFWDILTTEVK